MANIRSKNDRAVVAYLKPIVLAVNPLAKIYVCNHSGDRDESNGIVDVVTSQGPEDPPFTGNHILNVRIRIAHHAANQPGQTNLDANRLALDAMVDAVFDAMHISDNGCNYQATATLITAAGRALATTGTAQEQTNNADMTDYTCQFVQGFTYVGAPEDGEKSVSFVELMNLQMRACPSNVD